MKTLFARIISIILVCITVLSLFSCTDLNGNTDGTSGEAESETASTTADPFRDENGYLLDDIPKQDHGGEEITVLVYKQAQNHILPEEEGIDTIQSTVYMRSANVEERLGIVFDPVGENAAWGDKDSFIAKATAAGENYDLIASYSLWPQVLAVQGHLYNLNDCQYPNTEMPWWCDSMKEWEQNGKLFFAASNSSVKFIGEAEAVFANISMLENQGAQDPTDLVIDGRWTLEALYQMSALFHTDSPTADEDKTYGIVVDDPSRLDMFFYGSNLQTVKVGSDGVAEVCLDKNKEKLSNFVDTMISIFHRDEALIAANSVKTMLDGKTAFMCCCITHVTKLSDTTYTALPVPKYDAEQKEYRSVNTNGFDVWCIPVAAKDPELSATIMEAVASEDYRSVAPVYYDQYLKYRYSDNEVGSQIYDIIRNSVYVDFGRISAVNLGVTESIFRNPIKNGQNNISGSIKANVLVWSNKLEDILEAYGG